MNNITINNNPNKKRPIPDSPENRKRNKTVSSKLRRSIAFTGWRRNIGAREKIEAKELRSKHITLDLGS